MPVSRTLPVCLSQTCGRASLSPSVAVVSGCRFRPNFGRVKFDFFLFLQFGDTWRLSRGFTFADSVTFSVIQLSV